MQYTFKFPDIGEGLTEGKIYHWYVEAGQTIKSGDPLVEMETDKVVTDIPSPKTGKVVKTFGNVGDVIPVGGALVELEIEGIAAEAAPPAAVKTAQPVEEKNFGVVGVIEAAGESGALPASGEGRQPAAETAAVEQSKVLATPVARAMAKDMNIDISLVKGTGPEGRITKEDVEQYKPASALKPKAPKIELGSFQTMPLVEAVPLTQIRKTIAKNMLKSKQSTAHMSAMDEVEISELVHLREEYKARHVDSTFKISYLPFIIKAVTLALKAHPVLNADLEMEHEQILYKKYYNIGIAVDTAEGLIVPNIKDADKLSIIQLAEKVDDLVNRAHSRKLTLDEIRSGTFTITNYGSIGGLFAVPVINYPEVAILGIGRLVEKPIVKEGQIVIGKVLPISMSVDHRIVDGAEVARFMNDLMGMLADPVSMFLEE